MKRNFLRKFFYLPILLLILILSSCTSPLPEVQNATSTPSENAATPVVETEEVSPTIEIPKPENIIFLTNEENLTNQDAVIKNQLDQFAQSNENTFLEINNFDENLISNAKLVVAIDPEGNWVDQSANYNEVTFLFISDKELSLPDNGYQIKTLPSELYFLAGYTSALISSDWRVGGLLPDLSFNDSSSSQIFSNGVHYLCGLCYPVYTPLVSFPVTTSLVKTTDSSSILMSIGELTVSRLEIIFVDSEFLTEDVFLSLKNEGLIVISNKLVVAEDNIQPDISIYQDLSSVFVNFLNSIGEEPSNVMPVDLKVESNISTLTPGKLESLKIIINDLREGFIYPATVQN